MKPKSSKPSLEQNIGRALDRSLEQLDSDTLLQLQQARQKALAHPASRRAIIGVAIAAGLAAVVLAPTFYTEPQNATDVPDLAYLSEDPEFLSTLDMLTVLAPDNQ